MQLDASFVLSGPAGAFPISPSSLISPTSPADAALPAVAAPVGFADLLALAGDPDIVPEPATPSQPGTLDERIASDTPAAPVLHDAAVAPLPSSADDTTLADALGLLADVRARLGQDVPGHELPEAAPLPATPAVARTMHAQPLGAAEKTPVDAASVPAVGAEDIAAPRSELDTAGAEPDDRGRAETVVDDEAIAPAAALTADALPTPTPAATALRTAAPPMPARRAETAPAPSATTVVRDRGRPETDTATRTESKKEPRAEPRGPRSIAEPTPEPVPGASIAATSGAVLATRNATAEPTEKTPPARSLDAAASAALAPARPAVDSFARPPASAAEPTPTFQAQLSAAIDSPAFGAALGVQISTLVAGDISQASLHLHPAELGPIAVQIGLDGQFAQVHLAVEHAATRDKLEQALPELAQALLEAGFTMTGGGVSQQPREQPAAASAGGTAGASPREANAEPAPAAPAATPRSRQGLVDVFA